MNKVIKFEEKRISKGDLASELLTSNSETFDCALPHWWLEKVAKRFPDSDLEAFGNLSGHFVYVYNNDFNGSTAEYIMPLTKTGCEILGILSLY